METAVRNYRSNATCNGDLLSVWTTGSQETLFLQSHSDYFFGEMARHGGKAELVDKMLDPSAGSGQALHKRRQKALTG